mmetsp:Transcript_59552/g.158445  ORF Transcript_59552/g.158445 Transcript_59552/m.158445 type:complete len:299 (+) Transcript_59552:139-1035(+)
MVPTESTMMQSLNRKFRTTMTQWGASGAGQRRRRESKQTLLQMKKANRKRRERALMAKENKRMPERRLLRPKPQRTKLAKTRQRVLKHKRKARAGRLKEKERPKQRQRPKEKVKVKMEMNPKPGSSQMAIMRLLKVLTLSPGQRLRMVIPIVATLQPTVPLAVHRLDTVGAEDMAGCYRLSSRFPTTRWASSSERVVLPSRSWSTALEARSRSHQTLPGRARRSLAPSSWRAASSSSTGSSSLSRTRSVCRWRTSTRTRLSRGSLARPQPMPQAAVVLGRPRQPGSTEIRFPRRAAGC